MYRANSQWQTILDNLESLHGGGVMAITLPPCKLSRLPKADCLEDDYLYRVSPRHLFALNI